MQPYFVETMQPAAAGADIQQERQGGVTPQLDLYVATVRVSLPRSQPVAPGSDLR